MMPAEMICSFFISIGAIAAGRRYKILAMKRRHFLLIALTMLLVAVTIAVLIPPAPLDLSHDEEPFKSMVLPPKKVLGFGYMDGGSVGVQLIDKTGAVFDVSFPIDYDGIANAYPTAWQGDMNHLSPKPLKDPDRAKTIAIRLLEKYGDKSDEDSVRAVKALSGGAWATSVRLWKHIRDKF